MPQIWDETHKTDQRVIHIEPVTRLEGHAKIDIFLDAKGDVEQTYFQVVELRGFEVSGVLQRERESGSSVSARTATS